MSIVIINLYFKTLEEENEKLRCDLAEIRYV